MFRLSLEFWLFLLLEHTSIAHAHAGTEYGEAGRGASYLNRCHHHLFQSLASSYVHLNCTCKNPNDAIACTYAHTRMLAHVPSIVLRMTTTASITPNHDDDDRLSPSLSVSLCAWRALPLSVSGPSLVTELDVARWALLSPSWLLTNGDDTFGGEHSRSENPSSVLLWDVVKWLLII